MEDKELIYKAKKGDRDAFNQLILKYQDLAFNISLRMMGNTMKAEDVCQDAFIKAYQKILLFGEGSFKSWLMKIVTNTAIDQIRKNKRRNEISLISQDNQGEDIEDSIWMIDHDESPEEKIIKKQLNKAIQYCLNKLPFEFRAVVIMIDIQAFDYKETAKILKSPLGTIKSRLLRARKKMQVCLTTFEELLPDQFRYKNERVK